VWKEIFDDAIMVAYGAIKTVNGANTVAYGAIKI
jgi:hypothetical protein